jgi:Flp pilus assembly protein TadD
MTCAMDPERGAVWRALAAAAAASICLACGQGPAEPAAPSVNSSLPEGPRHLDPVLAGSALARANLANALAVAGKLDEAEHELVQALALAPGSPYLMADLARIRLRNGRALEAIEPAARAADLEGSAEPAFYLLATSARLAANQDIAAERDLERWEREHPPAALLRVSRGLLLERRGRPGDAERLYQAALNLDGTCAEALSGLVKLRFDRGDALGALTAIRQARGGGIGPRVWEAQALRRLGRLEEAEGPLRKALAAEPDHPVALAELGSLRAARGDYGEARVLLRRALALQPGLEPARNNLAEVERRLAE